MSQGGYGQVPAGEPLDFTWKGINVAGSKTMTPDQLAGFIGSRFKRGWRELVIYLYGAEVLRATRHPDDPS